MITSYKLISISVAVMLLLLLLCPPWKNERYNGHKELETSYAHSFIWKTPAPYYHNSKIDFGRLFLEISVLVVAVVIITLILGKTPQSGLPPPSLFLKIFAAISVVFIAVTGVGVTEKLIPYFDPHPCVAVGYIMVIVLLWKQIIFYRYRTCNQRANFFIMLFFGSLIALIIAILSS
jgi:hypothetical protein